VLVMLAMRSNTERRCRLLVILAQIVHAALAELVGLALAGDPQLPEREVVAAAED
jgi:hypothetical protein